jgi:hypothetical protein
MQYVTLTRVDAKLRDSNTATKITRVFPKIFKYYLAKFRRNFVTDFREIEEAGRSKEA